MKEVAISDWLRVSKFGNVDFNLKVGTQEIYFWSCYYRDPAVTQRNSVRLKICWSQKLDGPKTDSRLTMKWHICETIFEANSCETDCCLSRHPAVYDSAKSYVLPANSHKRRDTRHIALLMSSALTDNNKYSFSERRHVQKFRIIVATRQFGFRWYVCDMPRIIRYITFFLNLITMAVEVTRAFLSTQNR